MRTLTYNITTEYDGFAVQDYLKNVHGYSRRVITSLKQKRGLITLNGDHVRMVDFVKTGDVIKVNLEDTPHILPNPDLNVMIAYEDDDVIIFNKPYNMPVHPSRNHQTDTLANAFTYHTMQNGESLIFRPINRLDRDTSGLCVVAKNSLTASRLWKGVDKEYTAIVCGNFPQDNGTISAPIYRPDDFFTSRVVDERGQHAVTHYKVLNRVNNYTLLCIKLETGRTHQIRVHFSHFGYPLAGDDMYNGDTTHIKRQALCCNRVCFTHPITLEFVDICINIPEDMAKLVENE